MRSRWRQRLRREELSASLRRFLETGELALDGPEKPSLALYRMARPDSPALREAWRVHGPEILADWAKAHPDGSRPWAERALRPAAFTPDTPAAILNIQKRAGASTPNGGHT